ncbi:DUF4222 domain-containing protein [Acerihabitans sp. KWT182]|uniref:DUF4222 domain-containing protein n=1 Tax=Acerihabitans sp. KWT182 TaxID=3157919 RepID=A0AAU7QG46_9GAMM
MDEHRIPLDRRYRDFYGVAVHVIGWEPGKRRVIFMRDRYEYECAQPVERFQAKFKRLP